VKDLAEFREGESRRAGMRAPCGETCGRAPCGETCRSGVSAAALRVPQTRAEQLGFAQFREGEPGSRWAPARRESYYDGPANAHRGTGYGT
jgi:hypothetical protein